MLNYKLQSIWLIILLFWTLLLNVNIAVLGKSNYSCDHAIPVSSLLRTRIASIHVSLQSLDTWDTLQPTFLTKVRELSTLVLSHWIGQVSLWSSLSISSFLKMRDHEKNQSNHFTMKLNITTLGPLPCSFLPQF